MCVLFQVNLFFLIFFLINFFLEIPKLSVGQYELKVMVSVNSQQFFPANKVILFNSPEYGLKFEDIIKLDELEAKGGKKNQTAKATGVKK